eukprot:COSAG06_NODE_7152_length_2607_cov_30.058214_4_plen_129_part_00
MLCYAWAGHGPAGRMRWPALPLLVLLLLKLTGELGRAAGPAGSTTYDMPAVRQAVLELLKKTRSEFEAAPPPPGLPPAPPLALQLGFVSDSGEVTVQVGTDGRCARGTLARLGHASDLIRLPTSLPAD